MHAGRRQQATAGTRKSESIPDLTEASFITGETKGGQEDRTGEPSTTATTGITALETEEDSMANTTMDSTTAATGTPASATEVDTTPKLTTYSRWRLQ